MVFATEKCLFKIFYNLLLLPFPMKKISTLLLFCCVAGLRLDAQCNPDTEPPVMTTVNGLSVNILPTHMITLWHTDFIQSVQGNCSLPADIQLSMRRCGTCIGFPLDPDGMPVNYLTFTCDDLGTQLIEVWARDAAGNTSADTLYIIVQDYTSNCGSGGSGSLISCARTEANVPVSDVSWNLTGGSPALPPFFIDNTGPCVDLSYVPFLGSYTITPKRDNNPLNGVSTFDLVLINKHVLGKQALDSPYKMLAADANNSRSITTFDIVELRKMILGIYPELPNHTSWDFVPASFVFPNPQNPFQTVIPHSVTLADINAGNSDFIGYKIGDVNGSAASCNYFIAPESRSTAALLSGDALLHPGETRRIALRLSAPTVLLGMQFALQFDPEQLAIDGVFLSTALTPDHSPAGAPADEFFAQPEAGILTFSWDDPAAPVVAGGEPVVYLDVRALQAVQLSQVVQLAPRRLHPELYPAGSEPLGLQLAFSGQPTIGRTEIFAATPNPSSGPVLIPIALTEPAYAQIAVFDLSGRQLYQHEELLNAGFQRLAIPATALAGQHGVLAYRIQVGEVAAQGKLLRAP